jgi:hypothetical protein
MSATTTQNTEDEAHNGASRRQRGAISFPYADLTDAEKLAKAAWGIGGASPVEMDQLAAKLGHSTTASGGFRGKLGAARLFGLIVTSGMNVTLTDLGKKIADGRTTSVARADAFLRVPLFRAIYDEYRGNQLPGDEALEKVMAGLGVAPKQKERARQIFQRSAEQAGFSQTGRDKLIKPAFADGMETPEKPEHGETKQNEELPASVSDQPMIRGLFEQLPPAGVWPEAERTRWFDAAKAIFALVYKNEVKALPSESEQPSERSENGGRQEAKPL